MPSFQDIELVPGVNTQFTLEKNRAALSVTQLMRYKTGIPEKIGGWTNFFPTPISTSPVRDIHGFQGLLGNKSLGAGSLTSVSYISSGVLTDITPQTYTAARTISSGGANFSISSGSNVVTVTDPQSSAGVFSGVHIDVPISIGNLLLFGTYPINTAIDQNTYTILSSGVANTTITSSGAVPAFSVNAGSALVDVILPNNQFQKILGLFYNIVSSNVGFAFGGTIRIQGNYQITSIIDSTHFQITAPVQATITQPASNPAIPNASFTYYVCQGPPAASAPYGSSNYGSGPYGVGVPQNQGGGTKVTSIDWLLDNWGEVLVAFQANGPIYVWAPDFNFTQMQAIFTGPHVNICGFVSQPQQILMAIGSEQTDGLRFTGAQDPLLIRWSASNDYTNWVAAPNNTAGSFHVPTGSTLVGGLQAPLYGAFWTDIDVWTATWAGLPLIWAFLRVGTGCGLLGEHAADVAQGIIYWASPNNFFSLGPTGVQVLPCTVWDFIFQNIDTANQSKVRAAANSQFSEVSWFFPLSPAACAAMGVTYTGENNAYVKLHVGDEGKGGAAASEWDYGILARTAWVDTTVLGPPIGSDAAGNLLQHETGLYNASGTPINAYLETGYFYMGDGTDIAIVDWIIPDIRWQSGAGKTIPGTLLFTFFTTDYPASSIPGESGARPGERTYGPFMVTQSTQYINTRMRGRYWRCRIESNDVGTFWRIGQIKFRWGPSGRR